MNGGRRLSGLRCVAVFLLAVHAMASGGEDTDWRLELLAEEGGPVETAALRKIHAGYEISEDRLEKTVGRLGAEEFATREQAEREIRGMGREVLPWLRRMPPSDDPEVRARLAGIEKSLSMKGRWGRDDLLRCAVSSLLRERLDHDKSDPEGGLFVEFFKRPKPSLADGYGRFRFKADEGMVGLVSDGRLRLKGKNGSEGDQQLLLDAKEVTGRAVFPDAFRIEVSLGGDGGGEGGYHLGVSVGNVRALYHPGYPTGGFRFEQVGTREQVTGNVSMGFDPSTAALQRMCMDVRHRADGQVELEVSISEGDRTFVVKQVVEKQVVGKLDRIGLDRSGRDGGDALFDDLVVDLGTR